MMLTVEQKAAVEQVRHDLLAEDAWAEARGLERERELAKALMEDPSDDLARGARLGRIRHTGEERLAYYRSHGLARCDDYPGGDAAFVADVLSGKFHDADGDMAVPSREDAYIITKILDGSFRAGAGFLTYGYNLRVWKACDEALEKSGVPYVDRR